MKYSYTGIADDRIRLVVTKQLKDRNLWKLVAEQFAGTPDDGDLGWRGEYWGKAHARSVHELPIYPGRRTVHHYY